MVTAAHQKEKAQRDYKFREERTELQQRLGLQVKHLEEIKYTLYLIAIISAGIFIRLIFL